MQLEHYLRLFNERCSIMLLSTEALFNLRTKFMEHLRLHQSGIGRDDANLLFLFFIESLWNLGVHGNLPTAANKDQRRIAFAHHVLFNWISSVEAQG